jgi:cytochrome c oxidase subunit IV
VAEGTHHAAAAHEGAHGIGRYIAVWLILLGLTVATVVTGKMTGNIFLAMAIACTKATLVVLFFMHLYDEGGVNRLVFVVSVLFAVVLIVGVFGDIMTRLKVTLPNEGPMPFQGEHHAPGHGAAEPAHAPSH